MFFVLNKEKVYAYVISIITVCFLFFIADTTIQNTVETSSNTTNNVQNKTNIFDMNNTVK